MDFSLMSMLTNLNYASFLNKILINSDGIKFGGAETVSSALGKNALAGSLSPVGMLLVSLLDIFEKDHAIKSVKRV
tara:strand:- start:1677 stop:1904 length:228 start_codon:yes stop_codon:yes gene_type:complete